MKSTTLYRPLMNMKLFFKNLFLENRHADLSLALRSSRWIVTSQDLGAWRRLESVHSERVKRIFRDPRWGRGRGSVGTYTELRAGQGGGTRAP